MSSYSRWPSRCKTYRFMGITRSNRTDDAVTSADTNYRVRTGFLAGAGLVGRIAFVLMAVLVMAGCRDVRPVAKIGLIAPFEGLHRRSGYEALAAMRQAIADAPITPIGFIPLALDDSADPTLTRRAAEKLLVDHQVKAVVGPLAPALAAASGDLLGHGGVAWFAPFAIAPAGGFTAPLNNEAWASGLAAAVGAAVQKQGATTLWLAGERSGWPAWDEARWSAVTGLPARFLGRDAAAVAALTANDAIFWLGSSDAAAAFLNTHSALRVDTLFWLGMAGGDPILSEHLEIDRKLYWLTWSSLQYTDWAAHHEPSTPSAFLVYQATRAAIDAITGAAPAAATAWQVVLFEVEGGISLQSMRQGAIQLSLCVFI